MRRKYMAPPHAGAHTESRFAQRIQLKSTTNVALHFRASDPSTPAISMAYVTSPRSKCRRWVLQSIRTYTEQEITAQQAAIQPEMDQARMVVFLGFGFHEQNMRLLRARSAESWRRAYATVLRMDRDNYPTMRTAIARTVGCLEPNMPLLLDAYARRLLVDLRPSLMAAANM